MCHQSFVSKHPRSSLSLGQSFPKDLLPDGLDSTRPQTVRNSYPPPRRPDSTKVSVSTQPSSLPTSPLLPGVFPGPGRGSGTRASGYLWYRDVESTDRKMTFPSNPSGDKHSVDPVLHGCGIRDSFYHLREPVPVSRRDHESCWSTDWNHTRKDGESRFKT